MICVFLILFDLMSIFPWVHPLCLKRSDETPLGFSLIQFQVIFTMIALISENAHWAVWLMVSLGVCLMTLLAVHYVSIVMARSGCESHLTSAPYYLRCSEHSEWRLERLF